MNEKETPDGPEPSSSPVALATAPRVRGTAIWTEPTQRDNAWRAAQTLAQSELVPKAYQGRPADCMVALDYAQQLDVSPLLVMQNVYVVHGRPSVSATFGLTMANQRGPFKGAIRFRTEGEGETLAVTAYAYFADTGEEVSARVSMEMARAEGWTSNAKYRSMPEQMLCYRAAMFLIRRTCPEVLLGFQSVEEIEDVVVANGGIRGGGREVPAQTPTVEALRAEIEAEATKDVADRCRACNGSGAQGEGDDLEPCQNCDGTGVEPVAEAEVEAVEPESDADRKADAEYREHVQERGAETRAFWEESR